MDILSERYVVTYERRCYRNIRGVGDSRATEATKSDRGQLSSISSPSSTVDAFAYPAGNGGAFSISKETQYGSMADFNAARDKYVKSYNPPLGASVYTYQADLSATPTVTLPVGFSSEGLPLSMQFAGQALSEPTLCRIGNAYEEATGWYKKHPNV